VTKVVLASGSPRRSELLALLDIPFEVQPADVDESRRPGEEPLAYVERLARDKAGPSHARARWRSAPTRSSCTVAP